MSRLDTPSLKQKIRYRVSIVDNFIASLNNRQSLTGENLCSICDASVDCRNYFVHGTSKGPKYWLRIDLIGFFCRTLEFVFAVSDLVESGLELSQWLKEPVFAGRHPFDNYVFEFEKWFNEFEAFDENVVG